MLKTIHLVIKGKVQGVFFRASAKKEAEKLQVVGWVKNTASGDVEILCTGEETALQRFVQWCHIGPAGATVDEVVEQVAGSQPFEAFTIVREK